MRREERLARRKDFAAVYNSGRSWGNNLLILKALPNGLENNRYGFAVGKRLGKAVLRNRIKRLLREGVRQTPTKVGWDIVLIARKRINTADYHRIKERLENLLAQSQLLNATRPSK